jgi:hypothetical protein
METLQGCLASNFVITKDLNKHKALQISDLNRENEVRPSEI